MAPTRKSQRLRRAPPAPAAPLSTAAAPGSPSVRPLSAPRKRRGDTKEQASSSAAPPSVLESTGERLQQIERAYQRYPRIVDPSPLFPTLSMRSIRPSRYLEHNALHILGIYDVMRRKLAAMGWSSLWTMDDPTYVQLTVEFLSTFVYDGTRASFKIANVPHQLSKREIAECFGWPTSGKSSLTKAEASSFWREITRLPSAVYNGRAANYTDIVALELRYLSRVLAFTLFGRGSSGKVSKGELLVLYCFHYEQPVDFVPLLCNRLLKVAQQESGDIVVGGMITRIACYIAAFDETITDLPVVPGPISVDRDYLRHIRLIQRAPRGLWTINRHPRADVAPHDVSGSASTHAAPSISMAPDSTSVEERLSAVERNQRDVAQDVRELREDVADYFRYVGFTTRQRPGR